MALEIHAQPPPPPAHRFPTACERHPDEPVTGFCASCLRERLAGLDTARRNSTSSIPTSSASSALKSLFSRAAGGVVAGNGGPRPELRRCKSFSFAGGRSSSASFEPQRRSCDVRGRNTLWSLFHDEDRSRAGAQDPFLPSSSSAATAAAAAVAGEIEPARPSLGFPPSSSVAAPVIEGEEERDDDGDEIRPAEPVFVVGTSGEIDEIERASVEEMEKEAVVEMKPMKDYIDLDASSQANKKPPSKDFKEIAGSFWLAASVFSKKLQKWRRKQKLKKQGGKTAASGMPAAKKPPKNYSSFRRFRDTQSEVAVDAFGRRSCDTDPRFSLDAGRISFDDPRFSFDEPRASWDGYLIGGRSALPRLPPMLAVVEDAPVPAVERSDGLIPVEEDNTPPGGCAQTRDYYSDSSNRRRRSLDRSNSVRKAATEATDLKPASNAKVSPATGGTEFFPFPHGSILDRDSKDFSSNSLRDDYSESFESAYRDLHKEASAKKSRRWSKAWNIWGFIYRRGSGRGGGNVVDRSFSETWPELRNWEYSGKIRRSNSNVSSRRSFSGSTGFGSVRNGFEANGLGKKRRGEFVLERNRSARYSPGHVDNGMLRFYLTPMRSSRRNGGSGKGRQFNSHSFTRSMLRLY